MLDRIGVFTMAFGEERSGGGEWMTCWLQPPDAASPDYHGVARALQPGETQCYECGQWEALRWNLSVALYPVTVWLKPEQAITLDAFGDQTPGVTEQVTSFEFSVLPVDHPDRRHLTVTVSYRGKGGWAVTHCGECWSTTGGWEYEAMPSAREEQWLAEHRFDLDTAKAIARELAPGLVVNGDTAADVLGMGGR